MRKLRLKNYLTLKLLLFSCLLTLINCQKADDFSSSENVTSEKEFTIKPIFTKDIQNNTTVFNSINKLNAIKTQRTAFNKTITDSITGLQIDTDYATYLEYPNYNYHSYTFLVTNTPSGGGLENVFLSLQEDGTYKEFLAHYNLTDNEISLLNSNQTISLEGKITIVELTESNFGDAVNKNLYYDDDTSCWVSSTTIPGGNCSIGNHSWEQRYSCQIFLGNTSGTPPSPNHYMNSNVFCHDNGGDSGTNTIPNSPNEYPGNGSVNEPQDQTVIISSESIGLKKECKKITDLFIEYPTYKNELIQLATKTSENTEFGIFIDTGNDTNPVENLPQGTDGRIEIPPCPNDKYISIAHTHNSPANKTYSIFSDGDLVAFARNLHCGKIKTSKFVAFLSTANNTHYALTINNTSKFKNFIDYVKGYDAPANSGVIFNQENAEFVKNEFEIYYNDKIKAKIKSEVSDNINDEKAFLEMVQTNDIGLTLFETDANFEEFTKVSLDNNNDILPENCNN